MNATEELSRIIHGPTDSIYLRLWERNRCNFRDYQNIAVNGMFYIILTTIAFHPVLMCYIVLLVLDLRWTLNVISLVNAKPTYRMLRDFGILPFRQADLDNIVLNVLQKQFKY